MSRDLHARRTLLARRVRWLDRVRRPIAVVTAAICAPWLVYALRAAVEAEWPLSLAAIPAIMLAGVVWWATEAGLVLIIAFWETEHHQLSRDIGLPPARLIRRRDRRGRRDRA